MKTSTLFHDYLLMRTHPSLKKETLCFENHLKPFYGSFNLLKVSIQEHSKLIKYLADKGLEPGTINRIRSTMSAMYNVAIRQYTYGDVLRTNPFTAISKIKFMEKRMPYWDVNSVQKFLDSERGSHYYPLWLLMLNTGIRIGEAVAVHGKQFDQSANILSIDRIWCVVENGFRHETKNSRIRDIGLNKTIQKEIYPLIQVGPLFSRKGGDLLRADYVSKKVFPAACKRAGVENIGCHGMRHTFASNFIMNNGNIYDLQKILGHSDIATTERYTKFSRRHQQRVANVVSFSGNVIHGNFGQNATA